MLLQVHSYSNLDLSVLIACCNCLEWIAKLIIVWEINTESHSSFKFVRILLLY